jgi:polyisoprenoid-binding protein YceI
MMKQFFIALLMTLVIAQFSDAADNYQPDPNHSSVGFTVTHLVISKVHGRFKDFDATISYDPNDITKSTMTGTIKTASVDTGNSDRDSDLQSEDFFDSAKYPDITFQSKKITKSGSGYTMYGTLTMKGVAKDIALPFTLTGPIKGPGGKSRMGISASMKLNRKDYHLTWNKMMEAGGAVVGDDVVIDIDAELVQTTK